MLIRARPPIPFARNKTAYFSSPSLVLGLATQALG